MLISTESDSEADEADVRILRCLADLEPDLEAAWRKNEERYNAVLTATLRQSPRSSAQDD